MTGARPPDAVRLLARARSSTPSIDAPRRTLDPADPQVAATLEAVLQGGDATLALELSAAMRYVWLGSSPQRGIAFVRRALDLPGPAADGLRAEALNALGMLLGQTGQVDAARAALEDCVALHRRLGSGPELARALSNLGLALQLTGDLEGSARTLTDAVAVARASGAHHSETMALHALGSVAIQRGARDEARGWVEDALQAALATDDRQGIAVAYETLGGIALLDQRRDDALVSYAHALRERQRSLPVPELATTLAGAAILAADAGDLPLAATLSGAVARIGSSGVLPDPGVDALYAATLARLDALGAAERAGLEREGAALDRDAAITLALDYLEARP